VEVVQTSPLTVAGRGFKPKERIRVTANGRRKFVTAGRRGRFEVAFPAAKTCNGVFAVAVGSKGSRASVTFAQFSDIICLEPLRERPPSGRPLNSYSELARTNHRGME
jgi:hypothetical protein